MKRVLMLDTVEDANTFPRDTPGAGVQTFTVGHRVYPHHIARVDKIRAGAEVQLPDSQADRLIALGYARAMT